MTTIRSRDDVLTLLVHLGYLSYDIDSKSVYIPNEEVREEFIRAVTTGKLYCQEIHYELRGRSYYAIAFANRSGGFEIRNPYFKGCLGGKDITIVRHDKSGMQDRCCVLEGFMDFLSYMTLLKKGSKEVCREEPCDFVVLNSVHNLKKCLLRLDCYRFIHCYLDNDMAGKKTAETISGLYGERVTDESVRYAGYKDLNDYLLVRSK